MAQRTFLGDEAVALGAIDAGVSAAYAYPGTPSTEILEFLLEHRGRHGRPHAAWCANEKTAYESALGASFAGRRALVAMKHVGLNVAADPFVNSALVGIHAGLVLVVADDPGMHSSQNEQDSRFYADFAHVPCFEPATQQEAYLMTREAFDWSEHFGVPVVLRIVTRLAHSRSTIERAEARPERQAIKTARREAWTLLPQNARRQLRDLLRRQDDIRAGVEGTHWNQLELHAGHGLGILTTGIARPYLLENLAGTGFEASHLHLGVYPIAVGQVRRLAAHVERILVLEEGTPFVERLLRGLLPGSIAIGGRMSGEVPASGELTPDVVRAALGLGARRTLALDGFRLPARPPQLCPGCPHAHAYHALQQALEGLPTVTVTSDIGCYTLGTRPPHSIGESCVCMGASIGMAKGVAEAGLRPAVAVIGDSTFLHSGVTSLMDAVAAGAPLTVLILDNQTVAMTGTQDPILPSASIEAIVKAVGVDPEHCHVVDPHPRRVSENADVLRREIEHPGVSVVIARRECKEAFRRRQREAARAARQPGRHADEARTRR